MAGREEAQQPPLDLWVYYKDILSTVEAAVITKEPGVRPRLEQILREGRTTFQKLLKNPPPSKEDAELIKKATTEGMVLPGNEVSTRLSPALVQEANIVSDLFNLNQVAALTLLLHGEEQLPYYPGLTRGLVAVLLYFDSRKCLVQALRTLMSSRAGLSWSAEVPDDISTIVINFTTQLMNSDLTDTILTHLNTMQWNADVIALQRQAAIGNLHHVSTLRALHADIKENLADCLYCYSAQAGLPTQATLKILDYLSNQQPPNGNCALDDVNAALVMAVLAAIDSTGAVEGRDEHVVDFPLIADPNFIAAISRELNVEPSQRPSAAASGVPGSNPGGKWAWPGLLQLFQLAWGVSLAALRVGGVLTADTTPQLEDDEAYVDLALDGKVFHHLSELLLSGCTAFSKEEFYQRRMHSLLTDFLTMMPLKIKELRNRADEAARNKMMHEQEGIQFNVPLVGQHFQQILLCIAQLYQGDPLQLGLSEIYWCPSDMASSGNSSGVAAMGGSNNSKQLSLHKFVRLAGDLLMPSLYVPYVTMLTGLSDSPRAAPYCFNLLKFNSSNGNGSITVSLDHFFNSMNQYYQNLRQDLPNALQSSMGGLEHTIYRTKPMTRGISPQEVEGLAAVIDLVAVLARHSESARIALAEHPGWNVVPNALGLLGCPVLPTIKARLIKLLAALSLSRDLVMPMWQAIESAGLVTGDRPGLVIELQEMETRTEEYPVTRAFIKLMDKLTDKEVPNTLGAGSRPVVGFTPYLNYLQETVFNKYNTRTYKNLAEKWEMAYLCLNLFHKLVQLYEPSPADFIQSFGPSAGSSAQGIHPGYYILAHLHQSSLFLRTLLYLLDEGRELLDTYTIFPGRQNLQKAITCALQLLNVGLKSSEAYIEGGRSAGAPIVLTALGKLLLGMNPRSGKPDHLVNMMKFIHHSCSNNLPTHARLAAVKIVQHVAAYPGHQAAIMATLTSSPDMSKFVLKTFTEVLDTDEVDSEVEARQFGLTGNFGLPANLNTEASRLAILEMLQNGLGMAAPSFAHFLLGFDTTKSLGKSQLENQVIAGVRTPFHALLSLSAPLGSGEPCPLAVTSPRLATAIYKMIYYLVANNETSEPILRYLRSSEDYFAKQLASILCLVQDESTNKAHGLKSAAWLLQAAAIELRVLAKTRQSGQLSKLFGLLLDARHAFSNEEDNVAASANPSASVYGDTTLNQLSRTASLQTTTSLAGGRFDDTPLANHRLAAILAAIDFETERLAAPEWELFDDGQVGEVMRQCEVAVEDGASGAGRQINIARLHDILTAELASLDTGSATAGNQRSQIEMEIVAIIQYAERWNNVQEGAKARRDLLNAWKQVTEVLVATVPQDVFPPASRQHVLLQLLQNLLNKVTLCSNENGEILSGLENQVSSVVLLLTTSLRQTYDITATSDGAGGVDVRTSGHTNTFVSVLDRDNSVACYDQDLDGLYSASLQVILKGLINWTVRAGAGSQMIRTNLYSAFLAYLRIGADGIGADAPSGRSRRAANLSGGTKLARANIELILGQGGDALLEVVCRDACSGHEVRRMLALALIGKLVLLEGCASLDHRFRSTVGGGDGCGAVTRYLADHGLLKHLIESLVTEDDPALCELIAKTPANAVASASVKELYVFESKIGLLARVASRPMGAEILLQSGLMTRLAEFSVLDLRADPAHNLSSAGLQEDRGHRRTGMEVDGGDLGLLSRYHSVLFPVLRLCQTVLASLGGENRSAADLTLQCLIGHEEVISFILRGSTARASLHPELLQELALLTAVVSRAATLDLRFEPNKDAAGVELESQLGRIQKQMLSLLAQFQLTESLLSDLERYDESNTCLLLVMQIIANVSSYARCLVSSSANNSRSCRLIASPNLTEAVEMLSSNNGGVSSSASAPARPASLGLFVTSTRYLTAHIAKSQAALGELKEKSSDILTLPTSELLSIAGLSTTEKLPGMLVKRLAAEKLKEKVSSKRQELLLGAVALESLVFLLWRHLEHYLLYSGAAMAAAPATKYQATVRRLNETDGKNMASNAPGTALDMVDLEKLKADTRQVITDSFVFDRLTDIVEAVEETSADASEKDTINGFLQAIIRRSKRLALLHTQ